MTNFSELSISAQLKSNLTKTASPHRPRCKPWRLSRPLPAATSSPRPRRARARRSLSCCRSSSGCARPEGRACALVLSPTRELAIQIHEAFAKMAGGSGSARAVVVGGLSENTQLTGHPQGRAGAHRHPGPSCTISSAAGWSTSATIKIVVLDEADRMLDMGFLPTIQRILAATPARPADACSSRRPSKRRWRTWSSRHVRDAVRVEVGVHHQAGRTGRSAPLRSRADGKLEAAADHAARRAGLVPGVRPHQARRRPPGQATRRGRRQSRRASTATAARASATRRSRASRTGTTACWSRPTSPRAASTSKASRTS